MPDQTLSATEAREHIADLLTALAKDADTSTLRCHFHNRGYPHLDEAALTALRRLISTATVAVTWPNHTTTGCPVHGEPRPIPTLEDRMTAPDRIPVDCIRLGCGHTADQHHRMAGDTADTRSQDRAIRELTAERDDALASLRDVLAELRYSTAELRAAQEQIAMHSTPADEQTTEPDDDADLADALERAESGRIDRDDSVWWPRADGLWTTRYLEPLTLDRLEALCGPTRAVLLVDIEQDDEQEATAAGLGSPADRAQDEPLDPLGTGWTQGDNFHADRAQDRRPDCPICSGPVRETVGMVCRTCGTDCAPADRAQDGIRPAAWEQHVVDAVRAALVDALPPLAAAPEADRTATVAVRAIIDAGLAGDGGRCPQCGTRYPRTMPAGRDRRCWTCATEEVAGLDEYADRAQDPAAPVESAQDGPAGPGEGERTQEAADAHLGEPGGYEIVATRLHWGERGELVGGDVVASAVSARPTLGEALDELRSILGPAERAEG